VGEEEEEAGHLRLPNFARTFGRLALKNKHTNKLYDKHIGKLYDRMMGKSPPHNLWFDDGYLEDYTVIYPVLKRYNLTGILALVTGRIGRKGFLNIEQLKIMLSDGWKVASHSVTHRNFNKLSLEQVDWELRTSKEWIETNLGVTPIIFLPPYGVREITKLQKRHVLDYYRFNCTEPQHFHSRHFRLDWSREDADFSGADPKWNQEVREGVAEYERGMLRKLLEDIELNSGFWRGDLHELKLPSSPELPEGYTLKSVVANQASNKHKIAWQQLNEKQKWSVPNDALVFFVEFGDTVVATEYALSRNGVGTLHSAMVDERHRKQGFYRLMSLLGIQHLIKQGITVFELHTNIRILWHFWYSLGFRKVYRVSPHAQSQSKFQ